LPRIPIRRKYLRVAQRQAETAAEASVYAPRLGRTWQVGGDRERDARRSDMKICSLLPSGTEILYALGLGDQIVAVTHECDYPAETASKPRITENVIDHERLTSAEIDHHVTTNIGSHGSIYHLKQDLLETLK